MKFEARYVDADVRDRPSSPDVQVVGSRLEASLREDADGVERNLLTELPRRATV
jgi:hypothetical protein